MGLICLKLLGAQGCDFWSFCAVWTGFTCGQDALKVPLKCHRQRCICVSSKALTGCLVGAINTEGSSVPVLFLRDKGARESFPPTWSPTNSGNGWSCMALILGFQCCLGFWGLLVLRGRRLNPAGFGIFRVPRIPIAVHSWRGLISMGSVYTYAYFSITPTNK